MNPPLKPRPKTATIFMTLPVLFGGLLMIAIGGLGVAYWIGGAAASGERVDIVLEGSCAEAAQPLVRRRVDEIGLGDPQLEASGDALRVTVTLPGQSPDVERQSIPQMLGAAGLLTVHDGDEQLLGRKDIKQAKLQLGDSGEPLAVVVITEAAQDRLNESINADSEGVLQIRLDGVPLVDRPNVGRVIDQELRIIDAAELTPNDRMRLAIDRVLILNHGPLPCALSVASTTTSQ